MLAICDFFGEMSIFRFFAHLIELFVFSSFNKSSVDFLDINSLSGTCLQIFFPFHRLPFHPVDFFCVCVQKLFSLMQSHIFTLAFIACALGVILKQIINKTNVKELLLVFF